MWNCAKYPLTRLKLTSFGQQDVTTLALKDVNTDLANFIALELLLFVSLCGGFYILPRALTPMLDVLPGAYIPSRISVVDALVSLNLSVMCLEATNLTFVSWRVVICAKNCGLNDGKQENFLESNNWVPNVLKGTESLIKR